MTDTISIPYLFLVLGIAPTFGVLSWTYLRQNKRLPRKPKRYSLVIWAQIYLLLFTLGAAHAERIKLFPRKLPSGAAWILGSALLVALLMGVRHQWIRLDKDGRSRLGILLPLTQRELRWWIAVSVLAGVWEECAYRGAAYQLLLLLSHSVRVSLTACVITFAVAHLYQGWKSAFVIGILGLLSHFAVFLTGGLYLSISVHTIYDVLIGWSAVRFLGESNANKTGTPAVDE